MNDLESAAKKSGHTAVPGSEAQHAIARPSDGDVLWGIIWRLLLLAAADYAILLYVRFFQ